jgi:uncharacterized protein (DUF608 family)
MNFPPSAGAFDPTRRRFLASTSLALSGLAFTRLPAVAGPFDVSDFEKLVPRDKKLRPEWLASLTQRGQPEMFRGRELDYVGMPVGGIACGQLYLTGDGRLSYWDIFQPATTTDYDGKVWAGPKYAKPETGRFPVEQGFALRVNNGVTTRFLPLDRRGFNTIDFRGEYPIGRVRYQSPDLPIQVSLEAFSPFIPLNVEDSSLPATILEFTVRNTGSTPVEVSLAGWLENAVCHGADTGLPFRRRTRVRHAPGRVTLLGQSESKPAANEPPPRAEIVFADFEGTGYGDWTEEGTAFGGRPSRSPELPARLAITGLEGSGLANTHNSQKGEESVDADKHTGKLISPVFQIERRYIHFRIGGGNHPGQTGLQLVVDGKVALQATGQNGLAMRRAWFDVRHLEGKLAHLEIIDTATGGWGHTTVDHIVFGDTLPTASPEQVPGFGSIALTLLAEPTGAETATATALDVGANPTVDEVFRRLATPHSESERTTSLGEKTCGALARTFALQPGTETKVTWILSWWFPYYGQVSGEMAAIAGIQKLRRHYANRFEGAEAVAAYVAGNRERLAGQTRLWNRTWYDSTLPYWFLDRTFVSIDCLATQTLHRFDNGRWWGWEGVDCCPGTCQHVWQYAQGAARIFPEMERDWRERVDFGLAWRPNGAIDYRSESGRDVAHDGFCGTLIRVYREHQMSADGSFLRRIWPRVRQSIEFILAEDKDGDGLLEGRQFNTLDAAWFGPMGWISSLFVAAIAAGEAMAAEMGDTELAARCRGVVEAGRTNLVKQLFNGEYFIHRPPDFKHTNTNDGCHIDQLMGQSLAFQVGLPRIAPEKESRSALQALWTYSFTPDIGPYREGMKPVLPSGRWYAMAGEGGLLMCTWPKGGADKASGGGNPTFVGYFIECMTGFEYQVAAHMVWEGLVTEGLAITRTIHDRYAAAKRNPYNEIECSDHYSRAMMSYGVFLAACGFEHHGPKEHIAFAPRLSPDHFRCPFTSATGWGTYRQRRTGSEQIHDIEILWGRLSTRTLDLTLADGVTAGATEVTAGSRLLGSTTHQHGTRLHITLAESASLTPRESLQIRIRLT